MKTIDEVIEELQYWDTCHEYPECFYDDEVTRDALNYLKEYKRVQNKIEKIALGNIEDTLDKLDNKPLTWDELQKMEGKPVWIEGTHHKHWCIIKGIARKDLSEMEYITLAYLNNRNRIVTYDRRKGNFDVTWQAYRKEKK